MDTKYSTFETLTLLLSDDQHGFGKKTSFEDKKLKSAILDCLYTQGQKGFCLKFTIL